MNPRSFLTIGLLTVLLLVSCAQVPVQTEAPVQPAAPITAEPQTPPTSTPTAAEATVQATEVPPTEAPTEPPQPVATSRGPDLEATDPATVSLASGDLQLVEFFRFT